MKLLDAFRDPAAARGYLRKIESTLTHPWTIMEVCGGQTHAILRYGLDQLLPPSLRLVHGPGCPVCVTPIEKIDRAIALAQTPSVILCTFGDMLRVPGSQSDLYQAKAQGGQVQVLYSPMDALTAARQHPDKTVVLFAVGFETTVPAVAMSVFQAAREGLPNFRLLDSHVLVPPAMEAILSEPENRVQGFLAPGHVCTIEGIQPYAQLVQRFHVPIVVTGFEPLDILHGILLTVTQLERGTARVENAYTRSVLDEGNRPAQEMVREVFEVCDMPWRGLGVIPHSGLRLRKRYSFFNAEEIFENSLTQSIPTAKESLCISGMVLQGRKRPDECSAFGTQCNPERPLGAPMVSSEGACAAYYRYRCADE